MINVFKSIWEFAGEERGNIKKSIVSGFFYAIFNALQMGAIFIVISALVSNNKDKSVVIYSFGIMLISIIGQMMARYYSQLRKTHAGYFMVANKRMEIGNKLKNIPMGFFNEKSLGNITGISNTVLGDVENTAPVVLITTLGGFINVIIFTLYIYIFDYRIGGLVTLGVIIFILISSSMEKKSRIDAPRRQEAQEFLVGSVLEFIQGMGVVKAFNLNSLNNKRIDKDIDKSCERNTVLEKAMTPYIAWQQATLCIFSVLIIIASIYFYLNGTMELVYCLMMIIASFIVFEQLRSAGSGMAFLRITKASIDKANEINDVTIMDSNGSKIKTKNHNIEFNNVSFAYEKQMVLEDINIRIPERTMTAIIGPSGSGKTTFCNLIARFWDVSKGEVKIGGINVKEYTLDSLMKNISMVFQNVYLFGDTIENNIKFGTPNATLDDVKRAAKKACCHEFIMSLPEGYKTVIGEGGASLSGGEKQRISIARAILKDAPIVIFDEATANIDPENEDRLQKAIEELTKDKTIIMIAHRLKTVKNADQIIVLEEGRISQFGNHNKLINEKGIYKEFVLGRKQAMGWKLKSK